jgi:hypothetical protein
MVVLIDLWVVSLIKLGGGKGAVDPPLFFVPKNSLLLAIGLKRGK